MTWQSISFDWNHVRAFLATAEEGSLSGAARALGQTQPTLGRQVATLEEQLDITLFERTPRKMILTEAGREVLKHVQSMREAAEHIALTASGQSQNVEGKVSITASEVMAHEILPVFARQLRETAPMLEIDLVAADELRDLQRREADIAIRHVRPTQPDLTARLVKEATARLYASRDYLDRKGRPTSLEDLSEHDFVSFGDTERMIGFLADMGIPVTADNLRLGSASGVVSWALVRQGLGIAIMSDHVARRTAGIEPVLPDIDPVRFPIWLTTHRELHTSRRIRLVYDQLGSFLSNELF